MKPKILVGSPVSIHHAYCTPQYLEAIRNLTYPDYDILLADNSPTPEFCKYLRKQGVNCMRVGHKIKSIPDRILNGALYLGKHALENGYDYLFIVEQDIIPPGNAVELFLEDKKPALTGIYFNLKQMGREVYRVPVLYTWPSGGDKKQLLKNREELEKQNPELYKALKEGNFDFSKIRKQVSIEDLKRQRLLRVKASGAGCLFIHRSVLGKVPFRSNPEGFYDVMFGLDLENKGIPFYADTSVVCRHMVLSRPWTWERGEIKPVGK